jgi:hypothetical protein
MQRSNRERERERGRNIARYLESKSHLRVLIRTQLKEKKEKELTKEE